MSRIMLQRLSSALVLDGGGFYRGGGRSPFSGGQLGQGDAQDVEDPHGDRDEGHRHRAPVRGDNGCHDQDDDDGPAPLLGELFGGHHPERHQHPDEDRRFERDTESYHEPSHESDVLARREHRLHLRAGNSKEPAEAGRHDDPVAENDADREERHDHHHHADRVPSFLGLERGRREGEYLEENDRDGEDDRAEERELEPDQEGLHGGHVVESDRPCRSLQDSEYVPCEYPGDRECNPEGDCANDYSAAKLLQVLEVSHPDRCQLMPPARGPTTSARYRKGARRGSSGPLLEPCQSSHGTREAPARPTVRPWGGGTARR